MKAIMITVRLWWFYLTYKGIKKAEVRKRFAKDFKGKIYECVSKTNWKKDLMKIPEEEREFFKQFVGKVGLCFECDKVEMIQRFLEPEQWYMTYDLSGSDLLQKSCLSFKELDDYLLGGKGYAIHINNLEIFDKPKELSEFNAYCKKSGMECLHCKHYWTDDSAGYSIDRCSGKPLANAPQSFMFVEMGE